MKNSQAPKTEVEPTRAAVVARDGAHYVLRLYIAGATPCGIRAIANVRAICQDQLYGRHDLEVVDINQNREPSAGENFIAVPALIKTLPLPSRRIIGDLSETERVLIGLDLRTSSDKAAEDGGS